MDLMTLSCIAAFSPLVGAALAGFFGWKLGRAFAHWSAILSVAISFAASVAALWQVMHGARLDSEVYTWAAGEGPGPGAPPPDFSNTKALGRVLYTDYLFPFEIAAVILLVAIVAAIALTLRERKTTKYQHPSEQLLATKAERLKIVKR